MKDAEGSAARSSVWHRILRGAKIFIALFVILFVAGVIWRMPIVAERDRSTKVAQEIQDSHLTLADVDGSHLPPAPDPKLADATVEGIDANQNGIRDDVELAIFKKYPGTANLKLRAAELQYAKALQFYLTDVFTQETMQATMSAESRASLCLSDVLPSPVQGASDSVWNDFFHKVDALDKEVRDLVINNDPRKEAYDKAFDYMTSGGGAETPYCDVEQ